MAIAEKRKIGGQPFFTALVALPVPAPVTVRLGVGVLLHTIHEDRPVRLTRQVNFQHFAMLFADHPVFPGRAFLLCALALAIVGGASHRDADLDGVAVLAHRRKRWAARIWRNRGRGRGGRVAAGRGIADGDALRGALGHGKRGTECEGEHYGQCLERGHRDSPKSGRGERQKQRGARSLWHKRRGLLSKNAAMRRAQTELPTPEKRGQRGDIARHAQALWRAQPPDLPGHSQSQK